jgi:putative serine protease PepD
MDRESGRPRPVDARATFILRHVSFADDAADDDAGFRPPPHPDDRLWRHPSEMLSSRRAAAQSRTPRPQTRPSAWGTVAVAAAGMVLVAAGVSVITMGLSSAKQAGPIEQASIAPMGSRLGFSGLDPEQQPNADQLELAQRLAPSIVRVDSGGARGSGIVMRDTGVILTSAAVVGEAEKVVVALADGQLITSQLVDVDPTTGLAIIHLPDDGYTPVPLRSGQDLRSETASQPGGRQATALGVDSTGRVLIGAGQLGSQATKVDRDGLDPLDGVYVLDTVSLGSELRGGPVVADNGTVIGITVWTDEVQSYTLSMAAASKVVSDLVATGAARHTWLGIEGRDTTRADGPVGVFVDQVVDKSPSADALSHGDIIVAIDGHPIIGMSPLVAELRVHEPGDVVELTIDSHDDEGELRTQQVTLQPRPATLDSSEKG